LALTPFGTLRLAQLHVDPLTAPALTWWDAARSLNALAGEWRWRA
jgi:hypothetical protein